MPRRVNGAPSGDGAGPVSVSMRAVGESVRVSLLVRGSGGGGGRPRRQPLALYQAPRGGAATGGPAVAARQAQGAGTVQEGVVVAGPVGATASGLVAVATPAAGLVNSGEVAVQRAADGDGREAVRLEAEGGEGGRQVGKDARHVAVKLVADQGREVVQVLVQPLMAHC